MKVLVTGATGFIGSHLTRRLLDENYEVVCTGRSLQKLKALLAKTKALYLDITDRESVIRIIKEEKADVLFHCAALVESRSLENLRRVNVEGTRNILNACLTAGVERIVYLSSVAVVSGNTQVPLTDELPLKATNPYGQSKLEAEEVASSYRKKGLRIAFIKPCVVYGEGEPHILPVLVKLIQWRLLPIMGEGTSKLQLVGVENLVDLMMLSISKDEAYEGSYLIADREALTIKELFGYIAQLLEVRHPLHIPASLIPFFTHLPFAGRRFSFLLKDRVYSIKRLKEQLGYTPRISVYEGLKKAIKRKR